MSPSLLHRPSFCFSLDGAWVADPDDRGAVYLRDVATGDRLRRLGQGRQPVSATAFGPDRAWLAAGDARGRLWVWPTATDAAPRSWQAHEGELRRLACGPSGRLASGGDDGLVTIWCAETGREELVLRGHEDAITDLAFGPDGAVLATTSEDGTLQLWDAATGASLQVVATEARGRLAFSRLADGRLAAVSCGWREVVVWDPLAGARVRTCALDIYPTALALAPDGKTFAWISGDDGSLLLWDLAEVRPLREPIKHHGWFTSLAFSPDGSHLVVRGQRGELMLLAVEPDPPARPLGQVDHGVARLAVCPDGKWLAAAGAGPTIRRWALPGGQELESLACEGRPGRSLVVAGGHGLFAGAGPAVEAWEVVSGQRLRRLPPHRSPVRALAATPDGALLACGCADGSLWLHDLSALAGGKPVGTHEGGLGALAISPDGRWLATGGADGAVRLWNTVGGEAPRVLAGHRGAVNDLAFSPDGSVLASASDDHTVGLWQPASGTRTRVLGWHAGPVTGLAFAPDGASLVSASKDGTLRGWDCDGARPPRTIWQPTPPASVAFSPDGRLLLSADARGGVTLWPWTAPPSARPWAAADATKAHRTDLLALSPDGRWLASGAAGGELLLWDLATGRPRHALRGHTAAPAALAFSPDGLTLASACRLVVRLWGVEDGQARQILHGHKVAVRHVAFTPDGETVVGVAPDGAIRAWGVEGGEGVLAWAPQGGRRLSDALLSPDGGTVVLVTEAGVLEAWDLATGCLACEAGTVSRRNTELTIAPDGSSVLALVHAEPLALRRLPLRGGAPRELVRLPLAAAQRFVAGPRGLIAVAVTSPPLVLLLDAETARPRCEPLGHPALLTAMALSADGRLLVTAAEDGRLRLWDAGTGALVRELQGDGGV
ncbi:MAG: WD40 repeat domain-containing protein [Candidatus Sericytochromatia bacterium]|nr:WD40 repeat domain-containing protein [Candidatus Sericytochromatia bacterium]